MSPRSFPDERTVAAARAGHSAALEAVAAGYLPLVYNIVGRALPGDADVDDVVQETMVRIITNLDQLRDPDRMRSWVVAVSVRQIRDRLRSRRRREGASGQIPADAADPGADFADLTITRLGLSQQRREVAEATRWLDGHDRELLALWWLETAGQLSRADLAAAVGSPASRVAVRVHRMRTQLDTARIVVRGLAREPRCPGLSGSLAGWDGRPSPVWRKRLNRHVRDCPRCAPLAADLIDAERLLSGLPLVAPPAALGLSQLGLSQRGLGHRGLSQLGPGGSGPGTRSAPRPRGGSRPRPIRYRGGSAVTAKAGLAAAAVLVAAAGTVALTSGAVPLGPRHAAASAVRLADAGMPGGTAAARSARPGPVASYRLAPAESVTSSPAVSAPPAARPAAPKVSDRVPRARMVSSRELAPVRQNSRVAGRDNGQSTRYGRQSIWIFDDTTLRDPWGFLSNSGAATSDLNAANGITLTSRDPFHTRGGAPWAPLIPLTPAESGFQAAHAAASCTGSADRYCGASFAFWPGAVIADPARQRVLVFYGKLCRGGQPGTPCSGPLGKGLGTGVAALNMRTHRVTRLTATGGSPVESVEGTDPTLLFGPAQGFGSAALTVGRTAYIYGDCTYTCHLARVPMADLTDVSRWAYFAGRGPSGRARCSADPGQGAGTIAAGAAGGTVLWSPALHGWLNFFMPYGSNTVTYQIGGSPWGPWSASRKVISTSAASSSPNYATYGHAEYAARGGLIEYVTYFQPSTGEQRLVQVRFAR